MTEERTGENRCWPCTVANTAVGLVVAWLPLPAAILAGESSVVWLAVGWGVAITAFTGYRLVRRGSLPLAEPVAKLTGLHERIGPGSESDPEERR